MKKPHAGRGCRLVTGFPTNLRPRKPFALERRTSLTLEVCIDSVAGAQIAEQAGADRLELCANLVEGGTTPSTGMIRAVLRETLLPVMVMIRPRGGHFCYSSDELKTMRAEAEAVLEEPVAGIVVGALTNDGQVDSASLAPLCQLAAGRSVTFHRAFDQVANVDQALSALIDLGIDRVLTSGQQPSAELGIADLASLILRSKGQISVMPGCGVRAANIRRILDETGAREIHFSGSQTVETPVGFWRDSVPMSSPQTPGDLRRVATSLSEVQAICRAARGGGSRDTSART